jgi:hypothetical protein
MTTDVNPVFTDADEGLHPTGDSPLWQESVLLHWYDREQGIGGFHRLGHEANNQGGRAAVWSFLFDCSGWQYRRCGDVPLQAADRYAGGFSAAPALRFRFERGTAYWDIEDGPLRALLVCENLFPVVNPFPKADEVATQRFPNHFEVAGRVTGEVTYEGRRVAIRGFGYRDHSWGARDWSRGMPNHRWFTGTLGGEISFAAITAQAPTGRLTRVGYVHRGGHMIHATAVDVVAHIEPDGLTHRGGELTLTLPDSEIVHVKFKARAGVVFQRGNVVMVETICDAEGHGLKGYCDAEMSSNPRAGSGPVLLALNATIQDGFGPFKLLPFSFDGQ